MITDNDGVPLTDTGTLHLDFAALDMQRELLALEAGWPTHPEFALDALERLYARHGTDAGSLPLNEAQLALLEDMQSWNWAEMGAHVPDGDDHG